MAVHWGISELVILCIKRHPELMWNADFTKELMISTLEVRNVELFRLLDTHVVMRRSHVMEPSSLIGAVAKQPPGCPRDIAGAAFLLQRELQWFKMIEDMNSPLSSTDRKLNQDEFSEKHQDIIKEAKEWMKHTSSSCIILATLIITVTFAGTFILPGGNNDSTGEAIFIKKSLFKVFAILDGLALFFSFCSTVMFVAIFTSRCAMDDFHHSLPRNLILGLACLFLSLAGILGAFSSAFILLLTGEFEWIDIPVILMGGFVLLLFTISQLPLFVDMVKSTCWPRLRSQ